MAQALRTSLQAGGLTQGGLRPGLGGDNIFASSALDLNFGMTKSLGGLVTFTRASSGTYVGSDGLLKTATTNLLLQSEDFGTTWTRFAGLQFTANQAIAPNGLTTADLLAGDGTQIGYVEQPTSSSNQFVSGLSYTFSVYLKKANTSTVLTLLYGLTFNSGGSNPIATWNLDTGVPSFSNGCTGSMTAVGNGWYRCVVTDTATATETRNQQWLRMSVNAGDVYAWGAQLEQSSTVGEYMPTTSTINSAPRFDHNPTTGESLGLLVEEQRTNSIRNNTMVGAVAGTPGTLPTNWSQFLAPTGITRSVVGTGTENGISYVDIRFNGTASGSGELSLFPEASATLLFAAGTTFSASTWLSIVGGSTVNISSVRLRVLSYNVGTYLSEGQQTVALTSQLSRYTLNGYTTAATSDRVSYGITAQCTAAGAIDITLRIGLPQLEQGAFATSVIPTTGTTATRSADVASITGTNFSSWYRQDEGTVFADVNSAPVNNIAQLTFDISEGAGNERMFQRRNASGIVATAVLDNGVTQGDIGSVVIGASARYRSGFVYKLNDLEIVVNGGGSATDTSATIPTPDRLHIGQNYASGQSCNGTLRRLTFWPLRLPGSTLQQITA